MKYIVLVLTVPFTAINGIWVGILVSILNDEDKLWFKEHFERKLQFIHNMFHKL